MTSGGCNDWYIDPIPAAYDANGNPIPGAAIGRLVYFNKARTTNEGDYYFKFHFHLIRGQMFPAVILPIRPVIAAFSNGFALE